MFNAYTIYFYLPLLVAQIKENCVLFRAEKINNFFVGYLKMNKNCKKAINMYILCESEYVRTEQSGFQRQQTDAEELVSISCCRCCVDDTIAH